MIEISVIKSIVDLFKEAIGLLEKRQQDKREQFERTFKPTFDRLEIVAKEYYAIVSDASLKLETSDPELAEIVAVIRERRAALVIAREGILGEVAAFRLRYTYKAREKARAAPRDEFKELAYAFVDSIEHCFSHYDSWLYLESENRIEAELTEYPTFQWVIGVQMGSHISRLAESIQRVLAASKITGKSIFESNLAVLRRQAKEAMAEFEAGWRSVTEHYTALKLYCAA